MTPGVDQLPKVLNMASHGVQAVPSGAAGASLVVAVHLSHVVDQGRDGLQVVRESRPAVNQYDRKLIHISSARLPCPQPNAVVHLDPAHRHSDDTIRSQTTPGDPAFMPGGPFRRPGWSSRVRGWSCTAAPTSRTGHGGMGCRTRSTLCCRTGSGQRCLSRVRGALRSSYQRQTARSSWHREGPHRRHGPGLAGRRQVERRKRRPADRPRTRWFPAREQVRSRRALRRHPAPEPMTVQRTPACTGHGQGPFPERQQARPRHGRRSRCAKVRRKRRRRSVLQRLIACRAC